MPVWQAPKSSHSYCLMSIYILLAYDKSYDVITDGSEQKKKNQGLKLAIEQLPERLCGELGDHWLTLMLGPNLHHVIKESWHITFWSPTQTQVWFQFWVSPWDIFDWYMYIRSFWPNFICHIASVHAILRWKLLIITTMTCTWPQGVDSSAWVVGKLLRYGIVRRSPNMRVTWFCGLRSCWFAIGYWLGG